MDGYVQCPDCGAENDGAALFGDDGDSKPFGIYDGIVSVTEEPCCGCGKLIVLRLEAFDNS